MEEDVLSDLRRCERVTPACKTVPPHARRTMVEWLFDVHIRFKLQIDTYMRAIGLMDRVLDEQCPRDRIQLVGITCMMIAAKVEEIRPPEIRDYTWITDYGYTAEEVVAMELEVLRKADYYVTFPTVVCFTDACPRLLRAATLTPAVLERKPSEIAAAIQKREGELWSTIENAVVRRDK